MHGPLDGQPERLVGTLIRIEQDGFHAEFVLPSGAVAHMMFIGATDAENGLRTRVERAVAT